MSSSSFASRPPEASRGLAEGCRGLDFFSRRKHYLKHFLLKVSLSYNTTTMGNNTTQHGPAEKARPTARLLAGPCINHVAQEGGQDAHGPVVVQARSPPRRLDLAQMMSPKKVVKNPSLVETKKKDQPHSDGSLQVDSFE